MVAIIFPGPSGGGYFITWGITRWRISIKKLDEAFAEPATKPVPTKPSNYVDLKTGQTMYHEGSILYGGGGSCGCVGM